jgi:hypothetical protein
MKSGSSHAIAGLHLREKLGLREAACLSHRSSLLIEQWVGVTFCNESRTSAMPLNLTNGDSAFRCSLDIRRRLWPIWRAKVTSWPFPDVELQFGFHTRVFGPIIRTLNDTTRDDL